MSPEPFTIEDLAALQLEVVDLPPLPEAYLRDATHLAFLEATTRLYGRRSRFDSTDEARRFGGIPIYLEPSVPPGVLELRWPDGRVERVMLAGRLAVRPPVRLTDLTGS